MISQTRYTVAFAAVLNDTLLFSTEFPENWRLGNEFTEETL